MTAARRYNIAGIKPPEEVASNDAGGGDGTAFSRHFRMA